MIQEVYGMADGTANLYALLRRSITSAIQEAVFEERISCARLLEDIAADLPAHSEHLRVALQLASAIKSLPA